MKSFVCHSRIVVLLALMAIVGALVPGLALADGPVPGTDADNVGPSDVFFGSLLPVVTETGYVSLSVDGEGTTGSSATVQVQKPSGATVRVAYLAAASTGFSGYNIPSSSISVNGSPIPSWAFTTPSSISSWNHWANVTSLVKSTIDAAPAGTVNITIGEGSSSSIDGTILAVIFDDPNQAVSNTIVLLFGAQNINGDTFNIGLGEPLDKSDPNLILNMSLGISFGHQPSSQYSLVNVNGTRMTTSAGGEDDGQVANGALLTVGGVGDTNTNPANPYATGSMGIRYDDELYNLLPLVNTGDSSITVYSQNPSNDDNIFFSALFLASAAAVVDEGAILTPSAATNPVGTSHTVTVKIQDDNGNPVANRSVTFSIVSGPNAGNSFTATTNASGQAIYTYTGNTAGSDHIVAAFVDSHGQTRQSNGAVKTWVVTNTPPAVTADSPSVATNEGTAASNTGTYSDSDAGDNVSITASVEAVTKTGTNSGTWSWTNSAPDGPADYDVTITANDGTAPPVSVTFHVHVNNVAPTIRR
ncbi:MAG: hypothetical protein HW388_73 [Dehalococcoidia bacterium]|nr:hypothetical protein [Dehalococcoidia bacterium]